MRTVDVVTAVSVAIALLAVVRWVLAPGRVIGGWNALARTYRVDELPLGQRFRFVSARIGNELAPVLYRNVLNVVVNASGFGLSIQSVFGKAPAIFIRWTDVTTAESRPSQFGDAVLFRVRGPWPTITLYGTAARAATQAYEQARSTE